MNEQYLLAQIQRAQQDISELKQANIDAVREFTIKWTDLSKENERLREQNNKLTLYKEAADTIQKKLSDQTLPALDIRVNALERTVWVWTGALGVLYIVVGAFISLAIKKL